MNKETRHFLNRYYFGIMGFFLLSPLWANIVFAEDISSSNFIIRNPTISTGNGDASSQNFQLINTVMGQNAIGTSTSESFEIDSGFVYVYEPDFSVTIPSSSISFTPISVDTVSQNSEATLTDIGVTDTRGLAVGWSLTVATTHLTTKRSTMLLSGNNDTVTFSGVFAGVAFNNLAGKYILEITTGGELGTAKFKWTDPSGNITTGVTTASSVTLNDDMVAEFATATYEVGDKWMLPVDSFAYTNLTLSPGQVTVNYGDTGVTSGFAGEFSGSNKTSDSRTLMNATSGTGEGSYLQNIDLNQLIHANSLEGEFGGVITITIS